MKDEVEPPIEQNGKREIELIITQIPLDCYPGTMSRKSHCQQKIMENRDDNKAMIDRLILNSVSV
jgi:hypothetical protein